MVREVASKLTARTGTLWPMMTARGAAGFWRSSTLIAPESETESRVSLTQRHETCMSSTVVPRVKVSTHVSDATSHTLQVLSAEAERMNRESGDHAAEYTEPVWPESSPVRAPVLPSAM
eukprot:Amastigsp_a175102_367.p5 type:complete len:119 gc:universal Amastigsp_a175102_367:833-1189(+)